MGEMLSYVGSKSSEYVWQKKKEVQFADENFAREIMQLFTIGLVKLNIDGTTKLDSNGDTLATYSNDDITEYARVWTGFRRQSKRGNTEEREFSHLNSIDPMAIQVQWRDQWPKMGLEKTYIGDNNYTPCSDLPSDIFLKKKAKYRLLGKAKRSDIQNIDPLQILSLETSSLLRNALCQPTLEGICSHPGVVYLEDNLSCTGAECNLNEPPKLVDIGDNVHYEYIKSPCVHFPLRKNDNVVIVDSDGRIAIEPNDDTSTNRYHHSLTYFRVQWKDDKYPQADQNFCGNGACQIVAKRCRCQTTVESKRAFSQIPTRNEILSQLHIGANPHELDAYNFEENYPSFKLHSRDNLQRFQPHSVFVVRDDFGRLLYLKNMKSSVIILHMGKSQHSTFEFRDPPSFYGDVPEARDAQYETDAALDQYFYHDNTAPFLALRLIQRFGISNPSPRFVTTVALAFRSGKYTVPGVPDSPLFGNGMYGNLSATIAAILLDRESRNIVIDADPSHGGMREPVLKIVSTLRSMDYTQTNGDFFSLHNLDSIIGQSPYDLPSVFSFFLPEYAPPGPVTKASLVAPEAMVSQNSIGFLNGMISLVKYG